MSVLGRLCARVRRLALVIGAFLCASRIANAFQSAELAVGHWIEVKGELEGERSFVAEAAEVLDPTGEESLIGRVSAHERAGKLISVLGQPIEYSEKTDWIKVSPGEVEGARVKVEGYWRGPLKFSARSIATRPEGRDRIAGRVDSIVRTEGGHELSMLGFRVFLPDEVEIESERALESYAFAPQRKVRSAARIRDDDDYIPPSFVLGGDFQLGVRTEWNGRWEENHDLREDREDDRIDNQVAVRGELSWLPREDFYGLFGFRGSLLWRDDEEDGWERIEDASIAEAYGYVRDVLAPGLDLQVGRQDFDEEREWLYDQNLDAARMIYSRAGFRAELSVSTNWSDASEKDQNTENLIAYLSNNGPSRTLAAYVIDRRDDRSPDDYPIWFGARALGEWLPQTDVWAEYSVLRGYTGTTDLESYGYDLGLTWEGDAIEPWYLSLGWAFGSGDGDPGDGVDEAFRQTGLHDNNDKFGGVTSFRYYGELLDPELSNLSVLTLGVGRRVGRRSSVDLVWHRYAQDDAADSLFHAELDRRPDGLDRDLGWELDLILGNRAYENLDLELVVGTFEPGDAFASDADAAWLVAMQVRYRL